MLDFFKKIIDALDELDIEYMLSGSVAMGVYVIPRATRDFDFIISLNPDNIDAFVEKFSEGYYCDKDAIKDAVKRKSIFNIIDHHSGYKADFVILKNQEFRQKEFARKIKIEYFDKQINIVSAEDLLLSKLIWIQDIQSAIQMEDIKMLATIETLDWIYIKTWILKLQLATFNLL